ncbi:unnamed protein product, partial [Vitis vinifera]|uniref:Ubiquitin-like protease family profile domain-containing protein n=1 Tax=Vitis vinifera TaxID=29760 RepID=D7T168_VITVI
MTIALVIVVCFQLFVEFCQTFFKLYDIEKDVFQFSINWAPSILTQDNRWDCGVHVIKHMQTFKNGDSMKASNLCNYVKIRQEIACDLILHEGNREKQTMLTTVCTKTSTQAMKKIIIMIFVVFLIFIISISTYGHID